MIILFRPFQRTAADNDKLFNILRTFPFFRDHIPNHVLKELCVVALNETWKDPDFTSKFNWCYINIDVNSIFTLSAEKKNVYFLQYSESSKQIPQ